MHTQALHLLTFKCTMFPRSPCDSVDRICGLPAVGPLSLAFTLTQSLMWSDQILISHIPSSASGYIESQGNMGNRRVHIGMCVSVCWIRYLFDQKMWTTKGLLVTHYWYQPMSVTWVPPVTLIATWLLLEKLYSCVSLLGFGITAPVVWLMMTECSKCGFQVEKSTLLTTRKY